MLDICHGFLFQFNKGCKQINTFWKIYSYKYVSLFIYGIINILCDKKKSALTHDDEIKIFNNYLNYGGFPGLLAYDYPDEKITYLTDIYNSIMLKDVIDIEKISSVILFERLMEFIVCNMEKYSLQIQQQYLKLEKYNISTSTVLTYIKYAMNSLLLYQTKREDIIGKKILKVSEKHYMQTLDFIIYLMMKIKEIWTILLENIVYLELRRHGYKVTIGKLYDIEVDFVCKNLEKLHIFKYHNQ